MAKSEEISFTSSHEIKADRRILKTKKAIYEALVELMQKKKLNSITVTELAAQADINRKTFYTYYSTVNDVLDEGINELITSLKDLCVLCLRIIICSHLRLYLHFLIQLCLMQILQETFLLQTTEACFLTDSRKHCRRPFSKSW